MATFAERIKELRELRPYTQQELAEALGISKSAISMYEQGNREPDFEMQEAIADLFNVDIDYLVGRSDRTTVVVPAIDGSPKRRYLMDRVAKADDKQLKKISKLMEFIDDEEINNL